MYANYVPRQGYAPKVFTYVDKSGRPLPSVLVHLAAGAFAYIQETSTGKEVFNWLLSLSGLAALFTWGSICLSHIRFRKAWAHQGHTLDEIPFQAIFGVTGSWIGLILCVIVLIATVSAPVPHLQIISRNANTLLPVHQCHPPNRQRQRSCHCLPILLRMAYRPRHPVLLGRWLCLEERGRYQNRSNRC